MQIITRIFSKYEKPTTFFADEDASTDDELLASIVEGVAVVRPPPALGNSVIDASHLTDCSVLAASICSRVNDKHRSSPDVFDDDDDFEIPETQPFPEDDDNSGDGSAGDPEEQSTNKKMDDSDDDDDYFQVAPDTDPAAMIDAMQSQILMCDYAAVGWTGDNRRKSVINNKSNDSIVLTSAEVSTNVSKGHTDAEMSQLKWNERSETGAIVAAAVSERSMGDRSTSTTPDLELDGEPKDGKEMGVEKDGIGIDTTLNNDQRVPCSNTSGTSTASLKSTDVGSDKANETNASDKTIKDHEEKKNSSKSAVVDEPPTIAGTDRSPEKRTYDYLAETEAFDFENWGKERTDNENNESLKIAVYADLSVDKPTSNGRRYDPEAETQVEDFVIPAPNPAENKDRRYDYDAATQAVDFTAVPEAKSTSVADRQYDYEAATQANDFITVPMPSTSGSDRRYDCDAATQLVDFSKFPGAFGSVNDAETFRSPLMPAPRSKLQNSAKKTPRRIEGNSLSASYISFVQIDKFRFSICFAVNKSAVVDDDDDDIFNMLTQVAPTDKQASLSTDKSASSAEKPSSNQIFLSFHSTSLVINR